MKLVRNHKTTTRPSVHLALPHSHRRGSARPVRRREASPSRLRFWSDHALMALPRDGYKYELLDGEIIMSPGGFSHGNICLNIGTELRRFAQARHLGKVVDGQTGFRLRLGMPRKTVLAPDVSFVSQQRIDTSSVPMDKFFEGAPDLAVEVLSPGDRLSRIEKKLSLYFKNGTRLAWVVDPVARQVQVRLPAGATDIKGAEDVLDGGEVLRGFRVRVGLLFE